MRYAPCIQNSFKTHHVPLPQALTQARKDLKFLLVYVHSPGHQDTSWFCKEVLCSQQFVQFVADNMMLCFGVSIKTEEGVSGFLGCSHNAINGSNTCKPQISEPLLILVQGLWVSSTISLHKAMLEPTTKGIGILLID